MPSPLTLRFLVDDPARVQTGLLAIPVFEGGRAHGGAFEAVNGALGGLLRALMAEESFSGKADSQLVVHTHGKIAAARVALFGAGSADAFDFSDIPALGARVTRLASRLGLTSAALCASGIPRAADDSARATRLAVLGAELGRYAFDKYLTGERKKPSKLLELALVGVAEGAEIEVAATRGRRTAAAVAQVRDWVNEPAIEMTPSKLAAHAEAVAKTRGLDCRVLGPSECKKLGMNLFLGVSLGSAEEPRFIHLAYKPAGAKKRIALVGKGVTFDSGGLSLKPAQSMEDMKTDMAGAATVIATIAAVAELGCAHEVHAIVAATENMPGGRAYRPGDVITGMGGKSIEITNTDAEGRLTLADALAYALTLQPDEMIDIATLTGACVVALGHDIAGVMGSDPALVDRILAAAKRVGEPMWPLPLHDRLKETLKSEVADMKNSGERWGGAITAGLFLRDFTGGKPWAHLDIAGPSSSEKEHGIIAKGGTGFSVATLVEYLLA
ncbi:MAG: leucyl aminopeptidase [Myxococcota bacterium]